MENNVNNMILLSYAIPRYYKKRSSRKFKVLLPRKKTSYKRIGMNHHWNLLEEASERRHKHFSYLNFNNEINDNIVNEMRDRGAKSRKCIRTSNQPMPHVCTGPNYSLLTPPLTPQIGHGQFKFGSKANSPKHDLDTGEQGLPLTPSESDVFAY